MNTVSVRIWVTVVKRFTNTSLLTCSFNLSIARARENKAIMEFISQSANYRVDLLDAENTSCGRGGWNRFLCPSSVGRSWPEMKFSKGILPRNIASLSCIVRRRRYQTLQWRYRTIVWDPQKIRTTRCDYGKSYEENTRYQKRQPSTHYLRITTWYRCIPMKLWHDTPISLRSLRSI